MSKTIHQLVMCISLCALQVSASHGFNELIEVSRGEIYELKHEDPSRTKDCGLLLFKVIAFDHEFLLRLDQIIDPPSNGIHNRLRRAANTDLNWCNSKKCTYAGQVNHFASSCAVLTISEDSVLEGGFKVDSHGYVIEKYVSPNKTTSYLVKRQRLLQTNQSSSECSEVELKKLQLNMKIADHRSGYIHKTRSKRNIFTPTYVEIAVFTDETMTAFHGDDLPEYVRTLMSSVAMTYREASIGVFIEISYVGHIQIENEKNPIKIPSLAEDALLKFCEWQKRQNYNGKDDNFRYDVAILITRINLCRSTNDCALIGLAHLDRLCDEEESCAVIEDTGLSTSISISHELAHLFGVVHDGDKRCEDLGLKEQNIMAKVMQSSGGTWQWSDCSRHFFKEKLRTDSESLSCLRNKPTHQAVSSDEYRSLSQTAEGFRYSLDEQCMKAHGSDFRACTFQTGPPCGSLYCQNSTMNYCTSNRMPVADGTLCNETTSEDSICSRRRCIRGECSCWYERAPIHGHWGPWGPYGECSRSCGGGVQKRYRKCDNPAPANGGRYCIGNEVGVKTCNTHKCPMKTPGYREIQCSRFDGDTRGLSNLSANVIWVPKYEVIESDRCKLICQVLDDKLERSIVLRNTVEDGTKCGPEDETTDICVSGACVRVGCDHVYNSEESLPIKTFDKCGVCDGNNSTCKQFVHQFSINDYGVKMVTVIPENAVNVFISQPSVEPGYTDINHLILKDVTGRHGVVNDELSYVRNRRTFKYKSVSIEYSGVDAVVEWINITRRLTEPLALYVQKRGTSQMIVDVEYWIDTRVSRTLRRVQMMKREKVSPCSHLCNGTRTISVYTCPTQEGTDDYCPEPVVYSEKVERCNVDCSLSWFEHLAHQCSTRCGEGYRHVQFVCRLDNLNYHSWQLVDDQHCVKSVGPKPKLVRVCIGDCTGTGWEFSSWGMCKLTKDNRCIRRRNATCIGNHGLPVADSLCNSEFKQIEERCNEYECQKPRWTVTPWRKCSCVEGTQTRRVWCQLRGSTVPDSRCTGRKPSTTKDCKQKCLQAKWKVGSWTTCQHKCGAMNQTRSVSCVLSGRPVDSRWCSLSKKPKSWQPCENKPCYSWAARRWGKCIPPCGENSVKQLEIWCVQVDNNKPVPDRLCPSTKPVHTVRCNDVPECGRWIYSEWSTCNATLTTPGVRTRTAACVDHSGAVISNRMCLDSEKQATVKVCNFSRRLKPKWSVTKWGECLVDECGSGIQTRNVRCIVRKNGKVIKLPSVRCRHKKMPNGRRRCRSSRGCTPLQLRQLCHRNPSDSRCNVLRNYRTNRREQSPSEPRYGLRGQIFSARRSNPSVNERPKRSKLFRWNSSAWSHCSVVCGVGNMYRNVTCINIVENTIVPDYLCQQASKPLTVKPCNRTCYIQWISRNRQEDSWPLGVSQNHQICALVDVNRKFVKSMPISRCPKKINFEQTGARAINNGQPRWITGQWSQCRSKCNDGLKHRLVSCVNGRHRLPDHYCLKSPRPVSTEKCHLPAAEKSCFEFSRKRNCDIDGLYDIIVADIPVKLYCDAMKSGNPKEYIPLPAGPMRNYAEVFPLRSKNIDGLSSRSGFTGFMQLRLNIQNLTVVMDDFKFTETRYGNQIPFAHAGSCMLGIHNEGRFSIDLTGTRFSISAKTKWVGYNGFTADQQPLDIIQMYSSCGAAECEKCCPTPETGLMLAVV